MLGHDIHAWPDRDAALALLAGSDEAVALLAAAGEPSASSEAATDAILAAVRDGTPD